MTLRSRALLGTFILLIGGVFSLTTSRSEPPSRTGDTSQPLPTGARVRLRDKKTACLLRVRWLDRTQIACVDVDGTIQTWDATTGTLLRTRPTCEPAEELKVADLSSDAKRLALFGEDGLHLREAKKDLWHGDPDLAGRINDLGFSPDGRLFAIASSGLIRIREAKTGKVQLTLSLKENDYLHLGWSHDGRMLAVAGLDQNAVTVYEVATDQVRYRVQLEEPLLVAFARTGSHLVTVQPGGHLRVFEIGVEKPALELKADEEAVGALAWSSGATRLVASQGSVIRVWDMTGKQLSLLRGHEAPVRDLAFSPDGRLLVSASEDGSALVWEVPPATTRLRTTPVPWNADSWEHLASDDASRAFLAIRALRSRPEEAVKLLGTRLSPTAEIDLRRVSRLLADLDSDEFPSREKAETELRSLGLAVETTLRDVLAKTTSATMRQSIERLLEGIEENRNRQEHVSELRAIEVLESIGSPQPRQLLEKLAKGGASRLTAAAGEALDRLTKNQGERGASAP